MKKNGKKESTVLFIGDSITDCGRRGPNAPLGDGFARMTAELFAIRQPDCPIRFLNRGIGGNTTADLQERWTDDALVRTHEMFRKLIRHQRPDVFCPEPVHPNHTGHLAMAEAVYTALAPMLRRG